MNPSAKTSIRNASICEDCYPAEDERIVARDTLDLEDPLHQYPGELHFPPLCSDEIEEITKATVAMDANDSTLQITNVQFPPPP